MLNAISQFIDSNRILKIHHSIYNSIRHYHDTGELPAPPKTTSLVKDTIEKYKRVLSLRPRISRLEKWLDGGRKLTPTETQNYQKELALKKAELEDLEKALDLN